jgi:hypothetical protein
MRKNSKMKKTKAHSGPISTKMEKMFASQTSNTDNFTFMSRKGHFADSDTQSSFIFFINCVAGLKPGPSVREAAETTTLPRHSSTLFILYVFLRIIFMKGCPGCWGANPGSFGFRLFSHHSSAEPQRLPDKTSLHLRLICHAGLPDGFFSNQKYQFW